MNAQEKIDYQLNNKKIEFTISQEEIYVEFETSQKSELQRKAKEKFEELTLSSAIIQTTDHRWCANLSRSK